MCAQALLRGGSGVYMLIVWRDCVSDLKTVLGGKLSREELHHVSKRTAPDICVPVLIDPFHCCLRRQAGSLSGQICFIKQKGKLLSFPSDNPGTFPGTTHVETRPSVSSCSQYKGEMQPQEGTNSQARSRPTQLFPQTGLRRIPTEMRRRAESDNLDWRCGVDAKRHRTAG